MKRFLRMPSPAMLVAVIALVFALAGGAYAAKLGLSALSKGAKNKTVGVGKLTYANVTQTYNISQPGAFDGYKLTATCPTGTRVLGGGTKLLEEDYTSTNYFLVEDYPTTTGFTSHFFAGTATDPDTVQVTAACGVSRAVTSAPPAP
jgi:hypothetical protein